MFTHMLTQESASWFPWLLDILVKSTVLLTITGLAALACWRASAAQRHLIWTLAVIGVLLLPLLSAVLPSWHVVRLPEWRSTSANIQVPANTPIQPRTSHATAQDTQQPSSNILTANVETPRAPSSGTVEESSSTPMAPATPKPAMQTAVSSVWPTWPWYAWATLVWGIGSTLILAWLAYGYAVTRRMRKRATPAPEAWKTGVPAGVRLLVSHAIVMPVVVGIRRPTIMLPAQAVEWPEERRRVVLLHELAHIQRRDLLVHLLTQLACACYWINPLIWVAAYRMRVDRETACDDAVLYAEVKASDYAAHLLAVAGEWQQNPFAPVVGIAMARSSKVGKRIKWVLDERRNRNGVARWELLMLLTIILPFFVALAMATESDDYQQLPQSSVLSVSERLSSVVPTTIRPNSIVVSPDGNHTAFVQQEDGKQVVVLDGKHGPLFDYIKSPWHERNVSDLAKQVLPPSEQNPGLFFSPDGKRLAYVVGEWRHPGPINWREARVAFVVDGHTGTFYDEIREPVFSPDSLHYAYAARKGDRWCIVHDGREGQWHDNVGLPVFSPNGHHLAYSASDRKQLRLIRDGREENPALFTAGDYLGNIVYSPDSKRLLYLLGREISVSRLVVDGKERQEFGGVQEALFSPQGQVVLVNSNNQILVDGQYLDGAQYIAALQFMPGDRLTYYAQLNGIRGIQIDHDYLPRTQEPARYAQNHISRVQFLPHAQRVIFSHGGGRWATVEQVDSITTTGRSALGGAKLFYRVVHQAMDNQRSFSNREEGRIFTTMHDVRFSPDDRHLAYIADRANQTILVIDGHEEQLDYPVLRSQVQGTTGRQMIYFDAPDRFHYFELQRGAIKRVERVIPRYITRTGWYTNETNDIGLQVRAEIVNGFTIGEEALVNVYFKADDTFRTDANRIEISVSIADEKQPGFFCTQLSDDIPLKQALDKGVHTFRMRKWWGPVYSAFPAYAQPGPAQVSIFAHLARVVERTENSTTYAPDGQWGVSLPLLPVQIMPKSAGPRQPVAGAPYHGLVVSLECEQTNHTRQPVRFKVIEKNTGEQTLRYAFYRFPYYYHLYLTDAQDKPVEKTAETIASEYEEDHITAINRPQSVITLKPGEEKVRTYDLRQYFKSIPAGSYTLQVRRTARDFIGFTPVEGDRGALSLPCQFTISE